MLFERMRKLWALSNQNNCVEGPRPQPRLCALRLGRFELAACGWSADVAEAGLESASWVLSAEGQASTCVNVDGSTAAQWYVHSRLQSMSKLGRQGASVRTLQARQLGNPCMVNTKRHLQQCKHASVKTAAALKPRSLSCTFCPPRPACSVGWACSSLSRPAERRQRERRCTSAP